MSQIVPTDSIKPRGNPGTGVPWADIIEKVVEGACERWASDPNTMVNPGAFDVRAPTNSERAIMNGVCGESPAGLPPAPVIPFTGGQCCDITYIVQATSVNIDTGVSSTVTRSATGKVNGVASWETSTKTVIGFTYTRCNGETVRVAIHNFSKDAPPKFRMTGLGVSVQGGGPDECGDPEPAYPNPPTLPTPYPPNIVVPMPDGSNFDLPLNVAPILINNALNFDLGGIAVAVGPFNTEVNLGGNGVGNPSDLPPIPIDIPQLPPGIDDDLSDILDGVDDIKDIVGNLEPCDLQPVLDAIALVQMDTTAIRQGVIEILMDLENVATDVNHIRNQVDAIVAILERFPRRMLVKVTVNVLPPNPQRQDGGGTGPDVYYAGWAEFTRGGTAYGRSPIHFEQQLFWHFGDADGFAATFTNGSQGSWEILLMD